MKRQDPPRSDLAPPPGKGEPLPPATLRSRVSKDLFSDRNLEQLSHLLDDAFTVPGTRIRFGVDGLIGLVPIAGDVLAGLLSALIVIGAWVRGAPPVLLGRMLANLAIDVGIGIVPVLGDAFDIAWKANRRNYALLTRHIATPGRHTGRDWAFLLLLAVALFALFALPLVLLGYALAWLTHRR